MKKKKGRKKKDKLSKPCPCGSGRAYRKCCIEIDKYLHEERDSTIWNIKVPITYSLIWPKVVSFEEYLHRLGNVSAIKAIKLLSLMTVYLYHYETRDNVQLNYAEDYLTSIENAKVSRILRSAPKSVFLTDQLMGTVLFNSIYYPKRIN